MRSASEWSQRLLRGLKRYKYAALVVVVGLALLLIPGKSAKDTSNAAQPRQPESGIEESAYRSDVEARLEQALAQMQGAGAVRVMLTLKTGSETRYQTDVSTAADNDGARSSREQKTVILSAGSAYDEAAVSAVEYPRFQGALILCQGADDPTVKLNCINAVSALTGLKSDQITVVKMK